MRGSTPYIKKITDNFTDNLVTSLYNFLDVRTTNGQHLGGTNMSTVNGTHAVPAGIRARLGRSFNEDIRFKKTPEFSNIKRSVTKSGKPAFSKANNTSAAIYEII